ncbi:MAG: hypothetical protein KME06_15615 [Kastovskya adunca ATA6-11-RM4]|jgi:hypothetical protein|nr:hypothetical protein [Kastovskya adunca ATA6-11-RM4]
MYISPTLADELKRYLKQKADNGDKEARAVLERVEAAAASSPEARQQALSEPIENMELGC